MKAPGWSFRRAPAVLLSLLLLIGGAAPAPGSTGGSSTSRSSRRASPPPPIAKSLPPPSLAFLDLDQPFFPKVPAGATQHSSGQQPPALSNAITPFPTATQPTKPTKTMAIAMSVGIVTLGMLSALAFFLYRHKAMHPQETQKLVGGNSFERGVDYS